jgi:hypothetical protein
MRSRYLVLVFVCLLAISITASSKVFVLENYTIDTGVYGTPYPELIKNDTLGWSWSLDGTRTFISIVHNPVNITDSQTFMKGVLIILIRGLDGLDYNLTANDLSNNLSDYWYPLGAIDVSKPFPGWMAMPDSDKTIKVYVGLIGVGVGNADYIIIISNEKDDMVSLMMSELKVYRNEGSNTNARLKAIQKRL